ncbi:uncharacterized protein LOC111805369 [Cucurbita pepo subsp. pepo]|uniref:uncharacterized protein LOC111805369 n=1 Tax=Cucurbita pepo subsp. pepo TaxID=3664 RepID=UPI000C9D816F|nr:uncharacterized protein LOC111805369 [Cucurbita pepo subsp. pepo]
MSRLFSDRSRGSSRRHGSSSSSVIHDTTTITTSAAAASTSAATTSITMPVYPIDEIPSPFGDLGLQLSESELRVTAYEILIGSCRSTGGKPLTYISQSEKGVDRSASLSTATSLHRSITSTAVSKFKKALGLKSSSSARKRIIGGDESANQGRATSGLTVGELIRIQMRISEQVDSRIRRALLRITSGQLGRRIESMVLPLELFQQLKALDFQNNEEHMAWQRRYLKVLEIGLLLHPRLPLEKADDAPKRFRQIVRGAMEKPIDAGRNFEIIQDLRSIVLSLACRSFGESVPGMCHWADGFPLNLRLYQTLLEACFDANDATSIIEEVDEVLEHVKKTWVVLGMNQMLHNLCFSWVLFNRYVATGQVGSDLLSASKSLLAEVEDDVESYKDPIYSRILSTTLSSILVSTERKLLAYRNDFHSDNIECMQSLVSIAVLSSELLQNNQHDWKTIEVDVAYNKVDNYIRSSLRTAFSKKMEKVKSTIKNQKNPPHVLSVLAQEVSELAFDEKAMFSPIFKEWHPHAAGVAVSTIHSCYGKELKKFISGIDELTPNAIEVLNAADKLEKDLVQIAVGDSVDSEDGGKSIIREMPPYEAETLIANLVKTWISTRVDRLKEWIGRFLQQEVWNPRANKEHVAPSVVEVLRIVDESFEAFFLLSIPQHASLLPDLMTGLDKCLQQYILEAKSGCGSRSTYIPALPALTRCSKGSKFGVFKKKEKLQAGQGRTQFGITNASNSLSIPQLCVCINSLHHVRTELEVQERRAVARLKNLEPHYTDAVRNLAGKWFELSASLCVEGIKQLSEATAYKVVFHDLSQFLWDGLYIGEVASSRIEPFLQELEQYLETISSTVVHDRVRTRMITDVMKASFDGFLLVLLAGGPSRAFVKQDSEMIEEDFKFLTDLFWSNGDGLPADLISKHSGIVNGVIDLFRSDSESLIEQFKYVMVESHGVQAKSRLPLPPTSGHWEPTEPNTLLRVLCYRNDEIAAKFLKKTYNLPKKL